MQRVIQLEDQLAALGSSSEERPTKRARTSAATTTAAPEASGSAPSAAAVKADEKKRKIQVKKIFDRYVAHLAGVAWCLMGISRLKKECKADGVKFQGSSKTIKFDEVFEHSEFESLFGGKGYLVQPRPDNKPKSTVTIQTFVRASSFSSFPSELTM